MSSIRVLLAEPSRPSELEMWQRQLGPMGCAVYAPSRADDGELAELISDAHVMLVRRRRISGELIDHARELQLIQKIGRNVENIDVEAARRRDIAVRTALNPSWLGVAEHTVLLILALAKQLRNADQSVRNGVNPQQVPSQLTTETSYAYNWSQLAPLSLAYGQCLGLVGLGEIGQLVAERAQVLGMNVCYTRKRGSDTGADARGYGWRTLDDLLREADFVSLHVPLSDETASLIGERQLELMKPTAFLVNTSRGGVVDQDALVRALRAGTIAGAGLDVFRDEPLQVDNPLAGLDNVILTPHIAAVRPETVANPFPEIVNNVREVAGLLESTGI